MFREWVLQKAVSTATNRWLAQWVEHQTLHLAVTGSTPVPNAAKTAPRESVTKRPRGRASVGLPLALCSQRRESVVTCHVPAATQDGALQCADTACASPWQRQTDADGSARAMLKQRLRLSQINALDSTGSSALRIRMWDRRFASPPTAFFNEFPSGHNRLLTAVRPTFDFAVTTDCRRLIAS